MGWPAGSTCLGIGLGGFMWVAPMMGIIVPHWMLPLLLSLCIILMLVWPVSFVTKRLVTDKKQQLVVRIRVWSVLALITILGAYRLPLATSDSQILPTKDELTNSYPDISVQLDSIVSTEKRPYWQVGQPVMVNPHIVNYGNNVARAVRWTAHLSIRFAPLSDALEEEVFGRLPPLESLHPIDLGAKLGMWDTIVAGPLSSRDVTDLKDGRLIMLVVSRFSYRDAKGEHIVENCRFLQPPEDNDPIGIWHACHTHNRSL